MRVPVPSAGFEPATSVKRALASELQRRKRGGWLFSLVTLPCWFADYIYDSLRWDAGGHLTATREGSSTTCKPHPWGRRAIQTCPKCRRLASNQRPPRLQLGALANWATTALFVIVIIWWHVDNNPCCHNWLSRPWRESNPPRLLRQRSILPQDITAMNELIMSSLTAIKSDSIRSYIIWHTCIRLQSVAFNHMMVFNARSTRLFWFMYLIHRTNRGSETTGWNLTTTRRPATVVYS